jgi:hypothetical protein
MCAHEAAFQGWFFSVPAHHRDEHVVPLVRGTLCWTVTNNERKAHLPARITLDDKASAGGDAIARGGAGQGICTTPACLPTAAAPDPRMYAREGKSRHPRAGGAVLRAATAHHASERDPRCLLISPSGRRHVAGKRGHVTNRSSSIIDSLSVYFFSR